MKNIAFTIVFLFSAHAFSGEVDKKLHEKCLYPTVMLFSQPVNRSGSGVIVRSVKQEDDTYLNLAMSCAHIFKMAPAKFKKPDKKDDPPEVIGPRYEYTVQVGKYEDWSKLIGRMDYKCEEICVDRDRDVAFFTFVSEQKLHTAELDFSPKLYISNEVCKIGCGLGEPFRLDYGRITSMSESVGRLSNLKETYRISAPTILGDSGGPVFHNYKMFGIIQAIRTIPTSPISSCPVYHLSYVIPLKRYSESENLKKFLKDHEGFKNVIKE